MTRMTYVLGIDAGGTSARAVLATPDGQILATGRGGPANFQAVGDDMAVASLDRAIDEAVIAVGHSDSIRDDIATVVAGLAGMHVQADYDRFTLLMHRLLPSSQVHICNDGQVALAGATGGAPGVVVVAGTGSIAYGMDRPGRYLRCGGWGYIIDDEGSAYAITLAALHAASRAADGRTGPSSLMTAFGEAVGVPTFDDILRPVYGPPVLTRHQLAALAPLVTRCAADGDAVARQVLVEAGQDLAALALTLLRQCAAADEAYPVAYTGGVWTAGEFVLGPFRERVLAAYPRVALQPPLLSPAAGAVLLGISLLTGARIPDPSVIARLGQASGASAADARI